MLLITGTIRLPPSRLAEARPVMRAMIETSRAEAGCLHYSYAEDVLDPGLIRVNEAWRGRDELAAHSVSSHIVTWRSHWPALEFSGRDLTLYEAGEGEAV